MDRTTFLWICLFVAGSMLIWKLYEFAKVVRNLADNREQHKKENAEFIKTIKNSKKPGRIIFGLSIIVLVFIDYVLNAGFSKGIFNTDHSILPHYYLFNDEKLNVTFFISLLIGGYFWHSSVKVKKTVGISDDNPEGREIEISSWENAMAETSEKIKKNKKSFWGSIAALIGLVAYDHLYPDEEVDPKQLMNDIEEIVVEDQLNVDDGTDLNSSFFSDYYKFNQLLPGQSTILGEWQLFDLDCNFDRTHTTVYRHKISFYEGHCDLAPFITSNSKYKYKERVLCEFKGIKYPLTSIELELLDDGRLAFFQNEEKHILKRCK